MINTVRFEGYVPLSTTGALPVVPLSDAAKAAQAILNSVAAKKAAAEDLSRSQFAADRKRLNPVCHPMQTGIFLEGIQELSLSPIPETLEKEDQRVSLRSMAKAGSRDAQTVLDCESAIQHWQGALSLPHETSTEEEVNTAIKAVEAWVSLLISRKGLKEERDGILRELLPLEAAMKTIPFYLKGEKKALEAILLPLRSRVEEIKTALEYKPMKYGGQEFYVPENEEAKKAWHKAIYAVASLHGVENPPFQEFLKLFGKKISVVAKRIPPKASRRLYGTALYAVAGLKDTLRAYWPDKVSSFEEINKERIANIRSSKK